MTEEETIDADVAEEALNHCITAVLLRDGDSPHADAEYVEKAINVLADELDVDI